MKVLTSNFWRFIALSLVLVVGFSVSHVLANQASAWIPGAAAGKVEGELPDGTRFPLPGARVIRYDFNSWGEAECGPGVTSCFNYHYGVETTVDANGRYTLGNSTNTPGPVCYDSNPGGRAYRCPSGPKNGIDWSVSAPAGAIPECTPAQQGYNWCGFNCGLSKSRWTAYLPAGYILPAGLIALGYSPGEGVWTPDSREESFGNGGTKQNKDFVFKFDYPRPPICGSVTLSTGEGVPGVGILLQNDIGQTTQLSTDRNGKFSMIGLVKTNQNYAVRVSGNQTVPMSAPSGFTPPARTSESGWNWNFSINPNPGTQPWADTPLGSLSYESQKAGSGIDCSSANGSGKDCRCSFVYDRGQVQLPTGDFAINCRDQDYNGPLSYSITISNINLNGQPFDRSVIFLSMSSNNSNDMKVRQFLGTPTWENGSWFGYWITGISTPPVNGKISYIWNETMQFSNGKTLKQLAQFISDNLPTTYELTIAANLKTQYIQNDVIGSQKIPVRTNACAPAPGEEYCRVSYSPTDPKFGDTITLTCNSTLPEDVSKPHDFAIFDQSGSVLERIESPSNITTYTPTKVGNIRVCCQVCNQEDQVPTALEVVPEPSIPPQAP